MAKLRSEGPSGGAGQAARRALARALESITLEPARGALVQSELFAVEIVSTPRGEGGDRSCDLDLRVLPHALDREVPEEVLQAARHALTEHAAGSEPALQALAREELAALDGPRFDRGALAGLPILLWTTLAGETRLVARALTDRDGEARFAGVPADLSYHVRLAGQEVETVPLPAGAGRDDLAARRGTAAAPVRLGASRDERVCCYLTPGGGTRPGPSLSFELRGKPLVGGILLAVRRRGDADAAGEPAFLPLRARAEGVEGSEEGTWSTDAHPLPADLDLRADHEIDFELVARPGRGAPALEALASLLETMAVTRTSSARERRAGWEVEVQASPGRRAGSFDARIRVVAEGTEGTPGLKLLVWSANTTWLPTDPTDERGEVRFRRLPQASYRVRLVPRAMPAPALPQAAGEERGAGAVPARGAVRTRGTVRVRGGVPPAAPEPRLFHLPDRRLTARIGAAPDGRAVLGVETEAPELGGARLRYVLGAETGTLELGATALDGRWSGQARLEKGFAACAELVPSIEVLPPVRRT